MTGTGGARLKTSSERTNQIYIFGPLGLKTDLIGRKSMTFVGDEAACDALAAGTAYRGTAWLILSSLRDNQSKYCIILWADRVATGPNPADSEDLR